MPAQGDHGAAGGRREHRGADGGTGLGHEFPEGWPDYYDATLPSGGPLEEPRPSPESDRDRG
jgi:hypothetical protein